MQSNSNKFFLRKKHVMNLFLNILILVSKLLETHAVDKLSRTVVLLPYKKIFPLKKDELDEISGKVCELPLTINKSCPTLPWNCLDCNIN